MDPTEETKKPRTLALLVKVGDREYLVPQTNLLQLIEFCHTFNAGIHRVSVTRGEILSLEQLAVCVCDRNYRLDATYVDMGRVVPLGAGEVDTVVHTVAMSEIPVMTKAMVKQRADDIKLRMRQALEGGGEVSVKSFCDQYPEVSRDTISSYMSAVRRNLDGQGFTVERVKLGVYRLGVPNNMWGGYARTARNTAGLVADWYTPTALRANYERGNEVRIEDLEWTPIVLPDTIPVAAEQFTNPTTDANTGT